MPRDQARIQNLVAAGRKLRNESAGGGVDCVDCGYGTGRHPRRHRKTRQIGRSRNVNVPRRIHRQRLNGRRKVGRKDHLFGIGAELQHEARARCGLKGVAQRQIQRVRRSGQIEVPAASTARSFTVSAPLPLKVLKTAIFPAGSSFITKIAAIVSPEIRFRDICVSCRVRLNARDVVIAGIANESAELTPPARRSQKEQQMASHFPQIKDPRYAKSLTAAASYLPNVLGLPSDSGPGDSIHGPPRFVPVCARPARIF